MVPPQANEEDEKDASRPHNAIKGKRKALPSFSRQPHEWDATSFFPFSDAAGLPTHSQSRKRAVQHCSTAEEVPCGTRHGCQVRVRIRACTQEALRHRGRTGRTGGFM